MAWQLGILNVDLQNSEIDFPFQFSRKNLEKSLHHQLEYGGSYQDYVKAMSCFNDLVENAVPIETHGEKKQGTSKENVNLKQVYVLVSAMRDGTTIYPVQLEVKEFYDVDAKLYLNVVLTKIEAEVVETTSADNVGGPSPLVSTSIISLRQLFQNVNQQDSRFLKYVPDGFLSPAQKQARQDALQRQSEEYASYGIPKFSARDYAEQVDAQIVKYQERSNDSVSNRSLLANALETAAQNDSERKRLTKYKKTIDLIQTEEQNLRGRSTEQLEDVYSLHMMVFIC